MSTISRAAKRNTASHKVIHNLAAVSSKGIQEAPEFDETVRPSLKTGYCVETANPFFEGVLSRQILESV
jgi:hypothetical protein